MLQGLFCATCFFLPEVLYQVRFELSNASLHVGKKKTTWSKWRAIFSRNSFCCKGMLPIEKEYFYIMLHPFDEFVCLYCMFNRNMHVWSCFAIIYSVFTAFFRFGEKTHSWDFFHAGWTTRPYLREALQRGGGTRRYVNYT